MLSGVILVWSVNVFRERPSAGIGAGFLVIALGQAVGSPVAGTLTEAVGYIASFFAFAAAAVLAALVRPHKLDADASE
jgi:predicted MFS family arabinose efflux permease